VRTAAKIRVLVVDDSLTMRRRIFEVLAADPEIVVVGEASDGQGAIDMCAALRPDVVTLDMLLPVMNGLQATEHIMAHFPTPILVVSASTNRVDLFNTYDALSAGAIDVLEKPRGDEREGVWEERLRSMVRMVSRIPVITHPRARLAKLALTPASSAPAPVRSPAGPVQRPVVALGASTGGPGALVDVLREVPVDLPAPIFVVLHIDEPFGAAFADWLGQHTRRKVAYGRDKQLVAKLGSEVVMAPPGSHMLIRRGRLELSQGPERHSCRPSIDVLFESLARECEANTIACLLTGMGRDGAAGLLEVRRAGGLTIAQDERTSIVYGMPREAVLLGAAERVLPLGEIGRAITEAVARGIRA
jgi:two-component system, chemotaxis family, protein-glutamate methylesterase/glutaminase